MSTPMAAIRNRVGGTDLAGAVITVDCTGMSGTTAGVAGLLGAYSAEPDSPVEGAGGAVEPHPVRQSARATPTVKSGDFTVGAGASGRRRVIPGRRCADV